ncbi:MAG: hypothetical protein DSZ30_03130 [Aquificaceae bacterium]|nr:MAG: hypothetical protein DSZ30_03130 [Aquificaceae bacterium]
MRLTALVFYPQSPFRGEITTNTLFGAICWGIRKFYGGGELKNFLKSYEEKDYPFLFSSPLPLDSEGNLWFFRPPLEGSIFDDSDEGNLKETYPVSKAFKKVSLIEWKILEKILKGEIKTERDLFEEILNRASQNGKKPKNSQDLAEVIKEYTKRSPKLKDTTLTVKTPINRLTNTASEGGLHNEEVNVYNPFAVLFKVYNENWFEKIKTALKVVRLGGNKTVGLGRFEFEEKKEVIPEGLENFINKGERIYLLSPTIPSDLIDAENSFYEIKLERSAVDRSIGYFDPNFLKLPVWKKTVAYLKEGSVLKLKKPSEFVGGLKETLRVGNSKIYAYGLGFGLTFKC